MRWSSQTVTSLFRSYERQQVSTCQWNLSCATFCNQVGLTCCETHCPTSAAKEGGQLPQDRGDDQREAHTSRPATTAGETVDAVSSAINGMTRDTLTAAEAPPQKAASPCTVCLGLLERIASEQRWRSV